MSDIIDKTILYVKQTLKYAEAGHDWFHIQRVYRNAIKIAQNENCNINIVKLAALLHDIADSKFNNGDETIGPLKVKKFLEENNCAQSDLDHVIKIITNMSYKDSFKQNQFQSIELQIVQDADRLDAIGAIGIARTFHYGGFKNRLIYDPKIDPVIHQNKASYKNSTAPTINHFYEKLLLLKDNMNTQKGKQMAQERHEFMLKFLSQFYNEWDGN